MVAKGSSIAMKSPTCGIPGVSCCSMGQGHFVDGVSRFNAIVGRICGITSVCVRNATSGAQYVSGFVLHSSLDRSMWSLDILGELLRSPHNLVVHV